MAREMEIEAIVKPKVSDRDLFAAMQQIRNSLDKASMARGHRTLTKQLSSLFSGMVETGRFPTLSSASQFFRQATGGRLSPEKMAVVTSGVALARSQEQLKKSAINFEKRFLKTERNIGTFFEGPTAMGRDRLLDTIEGLEEETSQLLQAYKKSGEKVPKILTDANKKTAKWQKDILKTQIPKTGIAGVAKGLGAGALIGALYEGLKNVGKKAIEATGYAISRGETAWKDSLLYGTQYDPVVARGLANMLRMNETIFGDVQKRTLTYQERLKWKQVSPGEQIMWSRLGLMPMVTSGEAGANPRAFYEMLFKKLSSMPEAEALSALQTGGLDSQLLVAAKQYTLYSEKERQKILKEYESQVAREMHAEKETLKTRAWWNRAGTGISAEVGIMAANLVGSNNAARMFNLLPESVKGYSYENYLPANRAIVEGRNPTLVEKIQSSSIIPGDIKNAAGIIGSTANIVFNVTQNITGKDSEDIADKVIDAWDKDVMRNMNSAIGIKGTAK